MLQLVRDGELVPVDASTPVGQPALIRLDQHTNTLMGRLQPTNAPLQEDRQFIKLDSPTLKNLTSRQHLQITSLKTHDPPSNTEPVVIAPTYELKDLNSMNGVLVNATKVSQCTLKDGDLIIIGAAKNLQVGERIHRGLAGASDLVYLFSSDPSKPASLPASSVLRVPSRSGSVLQLKPMLNGRTSNRSSPHQSPVKLRASERGTSSAAVITGEEKENAIAAAVPAPRLVPPQRSYSFKPNAASRRAAEVAADGSSLNAAAGAMAGSSTDAVAIPLLPVLASAADGASSSDGSNRPKVSLADQLKSLASNLNPFRSRSPPITTSSSTATAPPSELAAAGQSSAASSSSAGAAAALVPPAAETDSRRSRSRSPTTSLRETAARRQKRRREEDGEAKHVESHMEEEEKKTNATSAVDVREPAEKKSRHDEDAAIDLTTEETPVAAANGASGTSPPAAVASSSAAAAATAASAPVRSASTLASEARQKLASELSDEFQCCICCDLLVHAHALQCSHTFCKQCIGIWLGKGSGGRGARTCPSCRAKITMDPVPVKSLDNAIDRIAATALTEEEQKERKAKIAADSNVSLPKIGGGGGGGRSRRGDRSEPMAAAAAAPRAAAAPLLPAFPSGRGNGYIAGVTRYLPMPWAAFLGMGAAPAAAAAAPVHAPPAAIPSSEESYRPEADEDDDDDDDESEEDSAMGSDDDEDESDSNSEDCPIFLEHARSGRSRCRHCNYCINLGEARFGVPVRSDYYDSITNQFYHVPCYAMCHLDRQRYPTMDTIAGFERLTREEQVVLRAYRRM